MFQLILPFQLELPFEEGTAPGAPGAGAGIGASAARPARGRRGRSRRRPADPGGEPPLFRAVNVERKS